MKIIDSFMYFDEDVVLDLRLNILKDHVDKFVIVESKIDHSGKKKKLNFDIKKFKKFQNKITYLTIDNLPIKKKLFDNSWRNEETWLRENFQRNYLNEGFKNCNDDDLIMVSDIDEIPDPKKIDYFNKKKKYACFVQKNFQMKLNLLNTSVPNWYGTRICIKKFLKSPQWLRDIKTKKRFWKIYKPSPPQLIFNGGWHFSFLKDSNAISRKLKSYAHQEYNTLEYNEVEMIEKKILNNEDILGRNYIYKKIEIDSSFPEFISQNKGVLNKWIV